MSKAVDLILKREKQEKAALRRVYFVRHDYDPCDEIADSKATLRETIDEMRAE